jgi:cytidylate kinase
MAARVAEEVVVAFCDGESMYRFSTTICVKYEIDLPAQFDVR